MRIGISGGTGFVGRHLARSLTTDGHEVVLIARGMDGRDRVSIDVATDGDGDGVGRGVPLESGDVVRVFVLPPSMVELSRRLHARAQDAEDVIQRRLGRAAGEIAMWAEYEYVLVNEDYDKTYIQLEHIYRAERLKRSRNPGLKAHVQTLLDEAQD